MKILVTGSAGHLGEALVLSLRAQGHAVTGLDLLASPCTSHVGSITDPALAQACMVGVDVVLHAATLHKPHVGSHRKQDFVDTNISGTLNLLEAAAAASVKAFVYTSTTSAFGDALTPPAGAPAAWITEQVASLPKNIYGASKTAAEDLCQLFSRNHGLACLVLRVSRFFPEGDDDDAARLGHVDANLKANELLNRRVDIADVVSAHVLAMQRAAELGFERFIISATTPFEHADLTELRHDPAAVMRRRVPGFEPIYRRLGWLPPAEVDRVYVNAQARVRLGWAPEFDFERCLWSLQQGQDPRSALARQVGAKGYHRPGLGV